MLKRMSLLVAVVALMWASAPSAQAAIIVGDLSIAGDLVPVNALTGTATGIGTATGLDFAILGSHSDARHPGQLHGHRRGRQFQQPRGYKWVDQRHLHFGSGHCELPATSGHQL